MAGQQQGEFPEFERQLAAIEPQPSRLDHAELLFRAGQESVRADRAESTSSLVVWQLSTALLAVVALGLARRIHNQQPETVERIKFVQVENAQSLVAESTASEEVPRPAASAPQAELSREHYVQQRRVAVGMGLDALGDPWPSQNAAQSNLTSYRDLRASYLGQDPSNHDDARPSARNQL